MILAMPSTFPLSSVCMWQMIRGGVIASLFRVGFSSSYYPGIVSWHPTYQPAGSDVHDARSDMFGTAVRGQELLNELSWRPSRSKLLGLSHFFHGGSHLWPIVVE